jgi:hypothetical protein
MMLAIALCDIYRTTFDRAASRVMIWLRQRAIVLGNRKSRPPTAAPGSSRYLSATYYGKIAVPARAKPLIFLVQLGGLEPPTS